MFHPLEIESCEENPPFIFMQTTSTEIAASLDQTAPMVEGIGILVGKNIDELILNTQSSLAVAQSSAKLVDDTLSLITALPLIGRR